MPKHLARLCALIVLGSVAAGCSSGEKNEPPVATPAVTLSRSDVAVGSPVDITYRFTVAQDAPAFTEPYLVFVHFLDADRERMWDDDHEPPTPTPQWKPGATIEYTRTLFAPKFPYVGAASVEVGLYSRTSGARLPLSGEDSGMRAYKVATFNMTLQSDNIFVIFKDGWHETEVADDGSQEWQWSRKVGTIAFRNPKRDVELLLEVDQPVNPPGGAQRVEVKNGEAVAGSFVVQPRQPRQLHRIALPATQLGAAENVELSISVDRTFVPSAVPELRSSDARELGVRVFRAYVQGTP